MVVGSVKFDPGVVIVRRAIVLLRAAVAADNRIETGPRLFRGVVDRGVRRGRPGAVHLRRILYLHHVVEFRVPFL